MLFLGAATLFAFGTVLVLLGATQADLARDLGLDLAHSGFLGATLAVGIGSGVLVAGPLADRVARKPLFVGACVITGTALFAIDPGRSYAVLGALLFLLGHGCGAYVTVVNAALVDRFRARTSSALALVHSAATFGACVGPLWVGVLRARGPWSNSFHALGWVHCALALAGLFVRLRGEQPVAARVRAAAPAWLRSPTLLALGLIGFAYVGTENAVTLFAVPWALDRADSENAGQWSISAFWFGLLLGRLALALRATERSLQLLAASGLLGGLTLCATNLLVLVPLAPATALAGLVLGPVYPLLVTLAAQRFPQSPGTAVGLVTAGGAVGGAFVPWLIGLVGDAYGLRAALTLLCAHAWLITAAALALLRADSQRERCARP